VFQVQIASNYVSNKMTFKTNTK